MSRWIVDHTLNPPSFMPASLDTTKMICITKLGDSWQVYFDPVTGKTHNCAEYRKQAEEEKKKPPG